MWEIFVPVVIRAVQENVTIVKQLCEYRVCKWSQPPNPNRRPTDYKSVTLPTEISRDPHWNGRSIFYHNCSPLIAFKLLAGNAPTIGVDLFDFVPANAKVFIYEGASGFSPEDGKFAEFSLVVQKKPTSLKIISVVGSGDIIPISSLTITFTSSIGSNYAIERSRDLVNWVTVVIIAGKETSTKFTDNEPINDGGDVFYRIRKGQ